MNRLEELLLKNILPTISFSVKWTLVMPLQSRLDHFRYLLYGLNVGHCTGNMRERHQHQNHPGESANKLHSHTHAIYTYVYVCMCTYICTWCTYGYYIWAYIITVILYTMCKYMCMFFTHYLAAFVSLYINDTNALWSVSSPDSFAVKWDIEPVAGFQLLYGFFLLPPFSHHSNSIAKDRREKRIKAKGDYVIVGLLPVD